MNGEHTRKEVVYLFGAGASQGCVSSTNSIRRILMGDLSLKLAIEARKEVTQPTFKSDTRLLDLVNTIVEEESNIEHIITFLDESSSSLHREFADRLRGVFEKVLRKELEAIEAEVGDDRFTLYSALIDMYQISGFRESLKAILTLNYDGFIEEASNRVFQKAVDYGVSIGDSGESIGNLKLFKLHGSFRWQDTWPISENGAEPTLWIPPGILKDKNQYPFNALWGLAREQLDCDILRIVGCRLSASDWDLISLLFTTRYSNANKAPYTIELIDSPIHADLLKKDYPYLDIRSIFEIEEYDLGNRIFSQVVGLEPEVFDLYNHEDHSSIIQSSICGDENWFRIWLINMAEALDLESSIDSIETETGVFSSMLNI